MSKSRRRIVNMRDEFYMRYAIRLAEKAKGKTSPNPLVGCVIVKNNSIIGTGYHKKAGKPHAEVEALRDAGPEAKGARMYVSLEPCNHFGKTPPCTEAIIKAGIKKVIVAMIDPNPLNKGKGIRKLRNAGVGVITGICRDQAMRINRPFIKRCATGMPFITLKIAETLDGKIAAANGNSKWISSDKSRGLVKTIRNEVDAVMVGINTVLRDDPLLISSKGDAKKPARIIVDTKLRIPERSRLVRTAKTYTTIIITSSGREKDKINRLKKCGVNLIEVNKKAHMLDLSSAMRVLSDMGISDILVEGGARLAGSLLDERLLDRVMFFIAPKIFGSDDAIGAISGNGAKDVKDAFKIGDLKTFKIDNDVVIEGDVLMFN